MNNLSIITTYVGSLLIGCMSLLSVIVATAMQVQGTMSKEATLAICFVGALLFSISFVVNRIVLDILYKNAKTTPRETT